MAKLKMHREPWSKSDDKALRKLAKEKTPTPKIAKSLGRTTGAVYQRASTQGVTLRSYARD